jgi:tetratricopeptide (TPR) repeat protein
VSCLSDNEVSGLIAGTLPGPEAAAARSHLDGCDECRALVAAALQRSDPSSRRDDDLVGPHRIGRYTVLRALGAGGMGVVYLAEDPQLDRQVALKLLRPGAQGADEQARLLREAQAMARLSHPNVIAVHDVGFAGGRVFVAMEYVDGGTLSAWLRERPRPVREILRAFLAAGQGLSAAHAAGLVHRDFKPDNVLVGSDGRVRVTDFGLARLQPAPARRERPTPDAPAQAVTQAGTLIGSPAYMSPEQLRGEPADARSDVFSFCISLHEALYGVRPFTGDTVSALREAIEQGRLQRPPAGARVPGWLRRALLRGLHPDPAQRPRSMDELLEVLEAAPLRPWRAGIAVGALALLAAILLGLRPGATAPACRKAGQELAGIWDEPVRQAARAAFFETRAPYAADALASVRAALDPYASAWLAMRIEACETALVRHEQSQELFDLRMECLEGRRRELQARTALFVRADADVVQRAQSLASSLPPLEPCADARTLRSQPKPPSPADAPKVAALRARLASALALRQAAKHKAAFEAMQAIVAEADALGYRALQAEARLEMASVNAVSSQPRQTLRELLAAVAAAAAAGAELLQARAWTGLVAVYQRLGDLPAAELAAAQARAGLERIGGDPTTEGTLERHLALRSMERDRFAEAEQHARRSLAIFESLPRPDPAALARSLRFLGMVLRAGPGIVEARGLLERARTLVLGALGPDHPDTLEAETSLADLDLAEGRYQRARETYERVVARLERALGKDSARINAPRAVLANVALLQRRFQDAEEIAGAALRSYQRVDGGPRVSSALYRLGQAQLGLGHLAEARASLQRALELDERIYGPKSSDSAANLEDLGLVELLEGKLPAARTRLRDALARLEGALGREDRYLSRPLQLLARVELADQRPAESLALCERARAVSRRWGFEHPDAAYAAICIGQAQLALGRWRAALASLDEARLMLQPMEEGPAVRALVAGLRARARWEERPGAASLREVERAARELAAGGEPLRMEGRELAAWAGERAQQAQR